MLPPSPIFFFFFFNDTATTEIYTLSLHDALPISRTDRSLCTQRDQRHNPPVPHDESRSEEHTSELQSPCNLVCRLLLEKKKKNKSPRSACDSTRCVDKARSWSGAIPRISYGSTTV